MNFSMTANDKQTVEQWRLLRNSRSLSAGSDSLQCSSNRQSELKALKKTPQMHHPASRTSFSDTITSCRKTAVVLKQSKVIFAELFTLSAKI